LHIFLLFCTLHAWGEISCVNRTCFYYMRFHVKLWIITICVIIGINYQVWTYPFQLYLMKSFQFLLLPVKLRNKINDVLLNDLMICYTASSKYSSDLMMSILFEHSPQTGLGKGIYLLILFSTLLAGYISYLLFQIVLSLTKWRASFVSI